MPKLLLIIGIFAACAALAQEFSSNYPAGSITTREQAAQALAAAEKEQARLAREFDARDAECYSKFFVNSCREKVRRERELARRDVGRVELEAKETRRRLDQEDAARRRAEQDRQQAAEDEARRAREAEARMQAKQRQDKALEASKGGLSPEEEERNRAEYERKQREHAERLAKEQQGAAERAQNATAYQQKQAEAAKRAEASAAEQKRRENRRAERKKELEKKEAEREAMRKRAEEAAQALPR
jgi:hypothetical protein